MRRFCRPIFVLLLIAGGLVSPAVADEPGDDTARTAIEQAWAGYTEALTTGDADAVATLFTEDAVWRQPVVGEISGRDAIRDFLAGGLEVGTIDRMTLESEELVVCGDRAFETGLYGQTTTIAATETTRDTGGSFGAWWQKGDDGVWRIAHMMIVPATGR